MSSLKITRRVDYEYSPKADDTPELVYVDVSIDGKHVISASGVDDAFALQNLIDRMRAAGFTEDDIYTAKDQWRIVLGEPPEGLPEDD